MTTSIYALMFDDPKHGESIMGSLVPGLGHVPNVFSWPRGPTNQHSLEMRLDFLRHLAEAHQKTTGHRCRIVRYTVRETIEEIGGERKN